MSEIKYHTPEKNKSKRTRTPFSELDLTFMTTQPSWGNEVSDELYSKVVKVTGQAYESPDGSLKIDAEPLWGLLAYYTRDLRLGNISGGAETTYCRHWLDFAGKCLRRGYVQSFLSALSKVVTVLELSQSKGGFLRKRQGTLTTEEIKATPEPAKKQIMGGKKER